MDIMNEVFEFADRIGFSHVGKLNTSSLVARQEVREMCADGKCKAYGKLWSCPPACGTVEHVQKKMNQYRRGVLVQTTGNLKDDFDQEAIDSTGIRHCKQFETLTRQIRMLVPHCLPLTAGGCRICIKCTCPDSPCRFPQRMLSSMEAYGLLVSDVCLQSGMQYNYGERTITYTSCILFDKKEQ